MHLFTAIVLVLCPVISATVPHDYDDRTPYSQRMLDSIVARKQGIELSYATNSTLEAGILALAIERTVAQYPDVKPKYSLYLKDVLEAASPLLRDANVDAFLPLDRFSVAYTIDKARGSGLVKPTGLMEEAYNAIKGSFLLQNVNRLGGYPYDAAFPETTSIEGAFSLLPYMALELMKIGGWDPDRQFYDSGPQREGNNLHNNLVQQLQIMHANTIDPETGLLVHGYNAIHNATWAGKDTGRSPFVWGRSLGLFFMGVAESWEVLQCTSPKMMTESKSFDGLAKICFGLKEVARPIVPALVKYADPNTGAWRQLTIAHDEQGNYIEGSSTALFIAAILMSQSNGLVPKDGQFREAAFRAFEYVVKNFVTDTGFGTIGFNQTVADCTLNSTASAEYYLSRPIVRNSVLGEAAFVLAALEVERDRVPIG